MTPAADMAGRNARGWRSVVGSSLTIFFTGAMFFGYLGVAGGYWTEHYGSGTGLIMTFALLALGIGMFCAGKWHMKIGTRRSFLLGVLCEVLALLCLIFGKSIYSCYLFGFLTGWNASFIYSPGLATVQNWFPNRRGLVTGIVNLIFGISAAIMAPVMNWMLEHFGYIRMNLILMILIVIFGVIGALLTEMPERSRMPEAQRAAHQQLLAELAEKTAAGTSKGPGKTYTPGQAMKTPAFWMLWLVWLFMGTAGISMVSLSKSYTVALGLTGVAALTCFNITNGVSRIIAGVLSDLIGRRTLGMCSFLLGGIGYALLPLAHTVVPFCILAACIGYAFGTLFAISGPLATDLFGLKYFGMIFGLVFTAYGFIGGICGPVISSAILRRTGSYTPVFIYLAVFCVLAAVFVMFAKHRKAAAQSGH